LGNCNILKVRKSNKRHFFLKYILLLLAVYSFVPTIAQQKDFNINDLLKPGAAPTKLVNDFTGTLTGEQIATLEKKLVKLDDSSFTQIAVVIVPSLQGNEVSDFNIKLGRAWGVGGKEFNNGVVLLISKEDKKLNIATGYGVEGALPDITSKHIIDDIIVPNFKGNDYYRGIDQGTDAIIAAVKGEYNTPRAKGGRSSSGRIIFIIIIVLFLLLSSGGGGKGGTFMSRRGARGMSGPIFWPGLGGGGGGWSGGGGGGGGGFGGFGGGSFGGGGASGSW
jgi:uncharacterized protein